MPKGPTWSQIHDPKNANRIETRDSGGYIRRYEQMGRTRVVLACPFCSAHVTCFVWSLAGGGKRCDCGAMCGSSGHFTHFADRDKSREPTNQKRDQ